jgi:hypothetical protein
VKPILPFLEHIFSQVIWRSGASVCFVRKYQRSDELMRKLRVTNQGLWRLNPGLKAFDEFYGGQVLLVPNRVREGAYPDGEFDLTPWRRRLEDFRTDPRKERFMDLNWMPPQAPFNAITGSNAKEATWGRFEYSDGSGDAITITDGWDTKNIGSIQLPGLAGIGIPVEKGTIPSKGSMRFNKKCHKQLLGLWTDWERHGLTKHILTFDGAFVPRYMRKATHVRANLSNHSWGTAFDINAKWNPLGKAPAKFGSEGAVQDMVELGYKWGFYWGGYFGGNRPDGMHFEVAKIL